MSRAAGGFRALDRPSRRVYRDLALITGCEWRGYGCYCARPQPPARSVIADCAPASLFESLESYALTHATLARPLQHEMRCGEILGSDAQRFVECHLALRAAAGLGVMGHFADLGQDVLRRDGVGVQRAQILAAFIHGRI